MRQLKFKLLVFIALAAFMVSCVEPILPQPIDRNTDLPDNALAIAPRLSGVPLSKAAGDPIPGDQVRDENKIESIDVFVYRKTTTGNTFYHRYTITPEAGESLLPNGESFLLEPNWRSVKYPDAATGVGYEGNHFKIYVIANIEVNVRESAIPASPTEKELRELISTSRESISSSYDVVRLVDGKGPDGDYYNPHIDKNLFLMDGVIEDWTPVDNSAQQYFTEPNNTNKTFEIARAAAKFKVTLDFSQDFLTSLGTPDANRLNFTKVIDTWTETGNKKTEVITSIGNVQYKFANFMPSTYDFNPNGFIDPDILADFRDANLWESSYRYDFSYRTPIDGGGFKYPYVDTTYSYSFSWDRSESAEKAPALAASVVYTKVTNHYNSDGSLSSSATTTETDYYRIPLVDVVNSENPVTEVKRNYFYQVTALINSMGATITDIEPTSVKLNYKVIPWQFNEATDVTEVEGSELLYFTADTTFILRGDGSKTTNLDFFTPKSEKLSSGLYKYEPVLSNVHVYYKPSASETADINSPSSRPGTYSNGNTQWTGSKANTGETVTITVVPGEDGGGVVRVTSMALNNRAVKYIEFDASVTFQVPVLDDQGQPTGNYEYVTVTHHYLIKHFPLDNIQSVTGAWASRWDGASSASRYFRKKYSRTVEREEEITQNAWLTAIGNDNNTRMNANSRDNARNGYYATGIGSQTTLTRQGNTVPRTNTPSITWDSSWYGTRYVTLRDDNWRSWEIEMPVNGITYDYVSNYTYTQNGGTRTGTATLVKYAHYYHIYQETETSYAPTGDGWTWEWEQCTEEQYNQASEENRKIESVPGVANNWVDWDLGYNNGSWNGNTGRTTSGYGGTYGNTNYITFTAKYWGPDYGGNSFCYNISYSNNNGRYSGSAVDNLTNNHMYVIQISKADAEVTLGHPVINSTTYQSDDDVVSPAFMIASQLGAVVNTNTSNYSSNAALAAANHCRTYMEVAENGRRFTGWRLPTQAEIAYIVGYQNDQAISGAGVFEDVLLGRYYFTLNLNSNTNRRAATAKANGTDSYFVRCIRDLSPEEVAELNESGTITTATY